MRVASYNVHSCIGIDGRCSPERIAAVIAEMNPDVVCLQELDVGRARTGGIDQGEKVAEILTMQYHFHATIEEVNGRYGDAIVSKMPLKLKGAQFFPEVPRPLPRESRGAIWIEVCADGRAWQIINTHFGLGYAERRFQARALVHDWIAPALAQPPVVLCGDLNSRPASVIHKIIGEPLRDAFRKSGSKHPRTFPTRWPMICLDYLFVSPEVNVQEVACWRSPLALFASDHFPIFAEISS